jgi:prolyl-tRNA synthetase
VIIIPISLGNWKETVLPRAKELFGVLQAQGLRVHLDAREEYTPGWKFSEWEMRGVPLRIEIGPRDVQQRQVVLVRRDTREKIAISIDEAISRVNQILDEIQKNLFQLALQFQRENTHQTDNYQEFKEIIEKKRGFIKTYWCGQTACEERIKEETQATIRVLPLDQPEDLREHQCLYCGQTAKWLVYFAKAY